MVAVISKDGLLTKGTDADVSGWTSPEDKEFFSRIKSEHSLYIMGRKTYESVGIKPDTGILRIVMTRNPEKYNDLSMEGQLEFTDKSPKDIVTKYQSLYESCLLLGGGEVYEEFLKQNLVSEIFLTVEPVVHKSGTPLLSSSKKLASFIGNINPETKILNAGGTKLLHYVLNL